MCLIYSVSPPVNNPEDTDKHKQVYTPLQKHQKEAT